MIEDGKFVVNWGRSWMTRGRCRGRCRRPRELAGLLRMRDVVEDAKNTVACASSQSVELPRVSSALVGVGELYTL